MFENPRKGRQARNFTTNAPKILDLKSSSEQIFSRKLSLGAPDHRNHVEIKVLMRQQKPYPVWFSCRRKGYLVKRQHSLKYYQAQHVISPDSFRRAKVAIGKSLSP